MTGAGARAAPAVLPADQGIFRTWPTLRAAGLVMPLSLAMAFGVVLNFAAIPISVSPDLIL